MTSSIFPGQPELSLAASAIFCLQLYVYVSASELHNHDTSQGHRQSWVHTCTDCVVLCIAQAEAAHQAAAGEASEAKALAVSLGQQGEEAHTVAVNLAAQLRRQEEEAQVGVTKHRYTGHFLCHMANSAIQPIRMK